MGWFEGKCCRAVPDLINCHHFWGSHFRAAVWSIFKLIPIKEYI